MWFGVRWFLPRKSLSKRSLEDRGGRAADFVFFVKVVEVVSVCVD